MSSDPRLAGHLDRTARNAAAVGAAALALLATACATARPRLAPGARVEHGVASWYGPDFHGRRTANGERYDMHELTAAHRTLPFGTIVDVHDLDNDRRVRVRINDRGPFRKQRIIDLSYQAARTLEMIGEGTARVELVPVFLPAVGTAPRWTVQIGAFLERQRAEELVASLVVSYPAVELRTAEPWSRVQIGEFVDREEAEALRGDLLDAGFEALVVSLP